ncbi:hypothetical protein AB205_0114770 [Aquarana catesbeiana]|uniref:SFR19-like C-terminal domain-containing protein n=1 Tax=Aquarana catesbeiana TaxID=8400 RepID=A0A2G9S566_AQUCT|nr:hypothetical protein AB205_0114770 [Aquarana catesbeiana]
MAYTCPIHRSTGKWSSLTVQQDCSWSMEPALDLMTSGTVHNSRPLECRTSFVLGRLEVCKNILFTGSHAVEKWTNVGPFTLSVIVDGTPMRCRVVTALLFKMEEANMASRAKAQELIQATNQILSHSKPSTSLVTQPPPPPVIPSLGHSAPSYIPYSSLPLSGNSSPPTPPGISSLNSQAIPSHTSSSFFNTTTIAELGKREGSTSSEGRGDTDKYLKKLHTQERAVEEVKLAIKPYYQRKEITKEDYKDILRKAVHKICHSKSGEINPVKVNNLVKAYVQRYKYFRKHGKKMEDDESGSSYRHTRHVAPKTNLLRFIIIIFFCFCFFFYSGYLISDCSEKRNYLLENIFLSSQQI